MGKIARYVLDLVDEIIGSPGTREVGFEWALGDLSEKTGARRRLPFDAVWSDRRVIVEVDENQHRQAVPFWDKPDRLTVSGVPRGEQRRLYDERKRTAARAEGYVVVEIPWERRPPIEKRDRDEDRAALTAILAEAGVL